MTQITDPTSLLFDPYRLVEVVFPNGTCTDEILARLAVVDTWRSVFVNGSPITDMGLRTLAGQANLLCIQLDGTLVTDEGLGWLRKSGRLKELYLHGTRATGVGLASLVHLPLRQLVIGHSAMTDADVEA